MAPHEEFLELCAVSIAGELTGAERERLHEHLKDCAACREALEEFKVTAKTGIPPLAGKFSSNMQAEPSVSVERAQAAFFERFDNEGGFGARATNGATGDLTAGPGRPIEPPSGTDWAQLWIPVAAIIVLAIALGIASYQIGIRRGVKTAAIPKADKNEAAVEEGLSDAGHELEQLRAQLVERDRAIVELKSEIQERSASTQRKASAALATEEVAARQRTDANDAKLKALEKQLDDEEQKRSEQVARATELETKVGELSKKLQDSELAVVQQKHELDNKNGTILQQQDLLSHDRDVRDLMGARDLYVVEVYDVAQTGETNKPYGRLFYTKGKSLIFYAYDLDQEPGLRSVNTFQAWGQRGPNKDRALNLGIFYEDSVANKRWVLKSNDAKDLAQIDAVFVTVEPDAHSRSPRGKQVLFAYLHINPNHP